MSVIAAPSATAEEARAARFLAASFLLAAGATATIATYLAVDGSPTIVDERVAAFLRALFVALYVVVGTYTWLRRPDSRLGLLIVGAGFLFALTSLNASTSSAIYPLGRLLFSAFVVYLVYVILCYPRDRLAAARERRFVRALAFAEAGLWVAALLLAETFPAGGPWADCADMCPGNAYNAVDSKPLSDVINALVTGLTAIALIGVAVAVAIRLRRAAAMQQRAYAPVFWAVVFTIFGYVLYTVSRRVDSQSSDVALRFIAVAGALSIPLAMLVGQARSRAFTASGVETLVAAGGARPEHVQALVREALGDPDAALVVRDDGGRFVDVGGRTIHLDGGPAAGRTLVTRDGQVVAALLHDPLIGDESGARAVAGAAFMLLENATLVEDLRASRARLAASAATERRRLERDLHDGAQQRLFALKLKLDDVYTRSDPAIAAELREVSDDVAAALQELRQVAHGIYPPVLIERGVGEALRARAMRTPAHVKVADEGAGRFDPPAELACYLCALEAIQNATRHAGRGATIEVSLRRFGSDVVFEIADDGAGFDSVRANGGLGLLSMRDRINAVGGRLDIDSSPGAGTTVRGSIPAGAP